MMDSKLKKKNSLFNKIDIFGYGFNFLVDSKDKKDTRIGAFLTIFYILIFFSLFFGFGYDMYNRKRPKVSFNTEISEYEKIKLFNKNFTYAYRVEDKGGIMITNESIIYQELNYFYYIIENGEWVKQFEYSLPNKRCRDVSFSREKEILFNISLEKWYCIDFDNVTMGGNWDGNFVYGFIINTRNCRPEKANCSSQQEVKKLFTKDSVSSNLFFSDLSLELLPSMDDFETPLKTSLVNRYEVLNLELTKRKIQTFKATTIMNDVGWFFPNIIEDKLFSSDFIMQDFTLNPA
jgi:hypothetical protein